MQSRRPGQRLDVVKVSAGVGGGAAGTSLVLESRLRQEGGQMCSPAHKVSDKGKADGARGLSPAGAPQRWAD